MKNKITILSLALALASCKTTSGPVGQASTEKHREFPEPKFADFAQPTPQKDTLYLLENDVMSNITAKLWESDTTAPKIIWVSKDKMICIKNRCKDKDGI